MRVNRQNAFTLIEVVIATFIVGIALIAMMGTIQTVTKQTAQLEEIYIANLVANNTLSELQLRAVWPEIGESSGTVEMANRTWYFDMVVSATDVESLRRVEVTSGMDDDLHRSSAYLTGFVSATTQIASRPVDWLNNYSAHPDSEQIDQNNNNLRAPGQYK